MKVRKKSVVVEAIQWTGDNYSEVFKFCQERTKMDTKSSCAMIHGDLCIKTLEGIMTASVGSYIICGVNNEFYPCAEEIFRKTYDIL